MLQNKNLFEKSSETLFAARPPPAFSEDESMNVQQDFAADDFIHLSQDTAAAADVEHSRGQRRRREHYPET